MTDVNAFVGRRMRRRRHLMGLTQQDLAAACGVTFQQVQKYESASTRLTVERLWKVAGALQVDVAYFFAGLAREDASPRASGRAVVRSWSPF
ncbi:helix-turn-helix domain-containing protein [Phenylobacterium sp.]|uniref:helix-turn-helix domain-containing protein n=1 Tax=Phenylobacterium sp. TaxID=1871053 RepID=UPI0025EF30D9|nr:helix-turn-helix transcriptional regulator [Phenylobacterium sp.]MBX3482376.1 helix-turn-helix transcriptional regulator [Phenylobacterium sp.]MCW5761307.1 helix-turn-helix transcriptional regulator [Phenylobacterium sp.]